MVNTMNNEKMKVLEMIASGKIAPAEGLDLLNALEDSNQKSSVSPDNRGRFLRIRVDSAQKNTKVNVNIPLGLLKVATKFADIGMKFIPAEAHQELQKKGINLSDIDFKELVQLVDQGLVDGKLVDIDTEEEGAGRTKVEIYVE